MSDRAKSLIGRLEVKSLDDYDDMKRFLLDEFKLTAMEYKARFDKASKRFDETHVLFASQLHNELRYYLSSCGIDNFENLCNLHFMEGDLVVVLAADNAGKLCPRWVGPVTIVKVKSPYSYHVDMGNGQVRHIHANKIRKFVARVHGCGVISDSDVDFGSLLQPVYDVCESKPSELSSTDRLTYLNAEQCNVLLSVHDEFNICFNDRPGLYTGAVHRIETMVEFKPKRKRAYRMPDCSSRT